jgi:hypothetical protein
MGACFSISFLAGCWFQVILILPVSTFLLVPSAFLCHSQHLLDPILYLALSVLSLNFPLGTSSHPVREKVTKFLFGLLSA